MQKLRVEYVTFVKGTLPLDDNVCCSCYITIVFLQRDNSGEAGRIYGFQGTLRISVFQGRNSSE
jgi:hypothetical protein